MYKKMISIIGLVFFAFVFMTSCQDGSNLFESGTESSQDAGTESLQKGNHYSGRSGNVYTMTNGAGGNEILVFNRDYDGLLTEAGSYSTGGLGTGAGLGNQNAVRLIRDNDYLLSVNAGSNDFAIFKVRGDHLNLLGTTPSGGETPISITTHGSLIYVLNAGGDGNISGFRILRHGQIKQIYNSTLPLSGAGTGPAQIEFSPDGRYLVVTEKATNLILTYKVGKHGQASGPVVNSSSAPTPFGFAFDKRGHIIVSEANGGSPNPSFVSSYKIRRDGTADVITAALPTLQIAACWIAVSGNGKYAYTTNAGSGTIGGLSISRHGSLSLLNDDGITGVTGDGSTPLDLAFSKGDKYLYSLNGGTHNISGFKVGKHGSLTHIGNFGALPETANGLAAR